VIGINKNNKGVKVKIEYDKVVYKSISAPDLDHGGWMDVEIIIQGGQDKNYYTVSVNSIAPIRVKGSNSFTELNFLMDVLEENEGALLKKLDIWAKEIIDAYKIVSANSKNWR
tara:strand:+ start:334 stop:672 length:339 start_codon:yes stop_codon:yes gene_type:complete